jgi:ABC-type cobalt transport system, permease component CbiQ and related transporters
MISDVVIGQYFPGNSIIHRLDPRIKLCLTLAQIVLLFASGGFIPLFLVVALILLTMLLSGVPLKLYFKSLKAIWVIVVFSSIFNLFYGTGTPLWTFGFLKITADGIRNCLFISLRIIALILSSSVLTFTTSPTSLTDAIERLLKPLQRLHVPVHEFAMMMTITLRFVPMLLEETEKIMSAQKARGADMESGGVMQRIRAMVPVLVPLFVSAFRRAMDLAMAMESRCYHGGAGRTKLKVLKVGKLDYTVLSCFAAATVVFVWLNVIL